MPFNLKEQKVNPKLETYIKETRVKTPNEIHIRVSHFDGGKMTGCEDDFACLV